MKDSLIIKVGTSTLLGAHELPSKSFDYIASSIIALRATYNVVLVTSGAIGFGVTQLGLHVRSSDVSELQALSMIGQVGLLRRWREAFDGETIGQMLVTRHDLEHAESRQNFIRSISSIWGYGAIPIVNENDAVSNDEISFGDNDQLAARVAVALGATRLVILTDQDGIQANFGTPLQARLSTVSLQEVGNHIQLNASAQGKGGATSKVLAAEIALNSGIEVYVAHAASSQAIERALSGNVGTKIVQ
ncbi:glutamate 5-kinase [Candidatus Saccharibacteria bacterium]|nr:glutamate 5-kinase [Candidatus Saccharibacteria bacterium]